VSIKQIHLSFAKQTMFMSPQRLELALGLEKLEAIQAKLSAKNMLCGNRVCQEMASRGCYREVSPINQKAGGSLTNHMETILVCLKNEQTLISKD